MLNPFLKKSLYCFCILLVCISKLWAQSQYLTKEDSFVNNQTGAHATILSGYGEVSYQRDQYLGNASLNVARAVLFIGHKFGSRISFFSELELEKAKVEGGQAGGEISFEQLLLKFTLNRNSYLLAGLFLPRMGLLNEDHLPINYWSVERPLLESQMLASTWREIGVGYYLQIPRLPLHFSLALVNGLNGEKMNSTGFRNARFDGQNASANNLALTSALRYFDGKLRVQLAEYLGGTSAMNSRRADSLGLESGFWGNPINIGVLDVLYQQKALVVKGVASYVYLPNASQINKAFANLAPKLMYGMYAEIGYNLLFKKNAPLQKHQLFVFGRYERLNFNAQMYAVSTGGSVVDGALNQHHAILGFCYLPIPNVTIKADIRILHTGEANLSLNPNISPAALPYQTNNSFVNLGLGYAF